MSRAFALAALPACLALLLFALNAAAMLPGRWLGALLSPDPRSPTELILHLSLLPRLLVAALAGAALALSGSLLQRAFHNPIAEASTLGITAGAQCAITLALIHFPATGALARMPLALTGAVLALALVLSLAQRRGGAARDLILAGLVVTFLLSGVNATLTLFHHDVLQSLFLWQAGSLEQDGWGSVQVLTPALAAALLLSPLAIRPLRLLALGDQAAEGLGLAAGRARLWLTLGAVALAALVTAEVGVLAFLGLLAPLLARGLAGRRMGARTGGRDPGFALCALTGAGILMLADQAVQALRPLITLQTGSALALAGSVLVLILLRRPLMPAPASLTPPYSSRPIGVKTPSWLLALLAGGLILAFAFGLGRVPGGWDIAPVAMLDWRLPRVAGAAASGAAFGLAGVMIQRLTGNPLASPELLGISAAAAFGLVLAVIFAGPGGRGLLYAATAAGALAGLVIILAAGARRRFSPEGLLLAGLAISMLLSALLAVLLSSGHPLAGQLLSWLSGSTARIALPEALLALLVIAVLLALAMLLHRWLDILPLGEAAALSLGLPLAKARGILVMIAGLATATGTLLTGPLGFIGLIAPALARIIARPNARAALPASAFCGAALMVLADWLGRIVAFPWQIPAGMMALLLGGVILVLYLARRPE